MNSTPVWQRWLPPYDPRLVDGANVTQDEHGRLIEADLAAELDKDTNRDYNNRDS